MTRDIRPPGTITLDDLKSLVDPPQKGTRATDQEVHEAAVKALDGMRGMSLATKRRVVRRALKILSA
jgi:hypothetical protein